MELKDSSNLLLSKSYPSNLIELAPLHNAELYITTINDKILFIISESKYDFLFEKTSFQIELPTFSELDYVYFSNSSYWHLQKIQETFDVVEKRIYSCD